MPAGTEPRWRWVLGTRQRLKPSLAASFRRRERWLTARSSPESPTSPMAARSSGSGTFWKLEATARARARSAAGSLMRMPPTTLTKTS